jgi:hypothetical protein
MLDRVTPMVQGGYNRGIQKCTILVSFRMEEAKKSFVALKAIHVLGSRYPVAAYKELTTSIVECAKCHQFRHLQATCRNNIKCGLCSHHHFTASHHCIKCDA